MRRWAPSPRARWWRTAGRLSYRGGGAREADRRERAGTAGSARDAAANDTGDGAPAGRRAAVGRLAAIGAGVLALLELGGAAASEANEGTGKRRTRKTRTGNGAASEGARIAGKGEANDGVADHAVESAPGEPAVEGEAEAKPPAAIGDRLPRGSAAADRDAAPSRFATVRQLAGYHPRR